MRDPLSDNTDHSMKVSGPAVDETPARPFLSLADGPDDGHDDVRWAYPEGHYKALAVRLAETGLL